MEKLFYILLIFIFTTLTSSAEILQSGITVDYVPKALFGSWMVKAKLKESNAHRAFKPQSLDYWNLSRIENTIKLENPLSNVNAEIQIEAIEENVIVFTKKVAYDNNKLLTDTVRIRLSNNEFTGINTLKLETFSLIDNRLIKTQTALYHIEGEKIAGESIFVK
jgi:hypothetical protein